MNFSERINSSNQTRPENPGKTEGHSQIQTRIPKVLIELKEEEKLNGQDSKESRNKFLKRFDWTGNILTEKKKQAIEGILVDYHDISARHRMDVGMSTKFKVKLSLKDDKAVYCQNLTMSIHLKEVIMVELAVMQKNMESSQYCLFPSTQVPYLHKGSPTENYVSLWNAGKPTVWLQMTMLTIIIQLALCQMQNNTWQERLSFSDLPATRLITACRWRTKGHWKCLHSISPSEFCLQKTCTMS